jgi:hypothetical protein
VLVLGWGGGGYLGIGIFFSPKNCSGSGTKKVRDSSKFLLLLRRQTVSKTVQQTKFKSVQVWDFDLLDSYDFHVMKSLQVGDFGAEINIEFFTGWFDACHVVFVTAWTV